MAVQQTQLAIKHALSGHRGAVSVLNNGHLGWVYHGQGDALDTAMRSERPIVLDVVTSLGPTFREVTSPLAAH